MTQDLPKLHYVFELGPESQGKSLEQLREEIPKPNWHIVASCTGDEYIPRYDKDLRAYVLDYLLITKLKRSIHINGIPLGSENLFVTGCHGYAIEAIRLALEDMEALRMIYNKAGTNPFQALFRADAGIEKVSPSLLKWIKRESIIKPKRAKFLEVIPFS
jgi:hypothetical protein